MQRSLMQKPVIRKRREGMALDWQTFAQDAPTLAASGWKLLRRFGMPLGFLSCIRPDGRLHLQPCHPLLLDGRLYLRRPRMRAELFLGSGHYQMRSQPPGSTRDRFEFSGCIRLLDSDELTDSLQQRLVALEASTRQGEASEALPHEAAWLELRIEEACLFRWEGNEVRLLCWRCLDRARGQGRAREQRESAADPASSAAPLQVAALASGRASRKLDAPRGTGDPLGSFMTGPRRSVCISASTALPCLLS